jgi:hypothetical protein
MQFCKDCGGVLNLFGNDEHDLCSACIQHQKNLARKVEPAAADPKVGGSAELLAGTVLTLENGRMVLRSKEGWELWSAAQGMPAELSAMLARARRIYQIRLRRLKK